MLEIGRRRRVIGTDGAVTVFVALRRCLPALLLWGSDRRRLSDDDSSFMAHGVKRPEVHTGSS